MGQHSNLKTWSNNISNAYYLNIPRLSELAAKAGIEITPKIELLLDDVENLHSLNFELNHLTTYFENQVLPKLQLQVYPIGEIHDLNDRYIGILCIFNRRFRTKNVPSIDELEGFKPKGDTLVDPHIYFEGQDRWRFIMSITPKWITTASAFSHLKSGTLHAAGLCRIEDVKEDEKQIIASPFVIGTQRSILD